MARRKTEDSKTAAILSYSQEHPGEAPSAVAAALKDQGINVSPQYVSTIRSKFGMAGSRKRRGRRRKTKAKSAAATPARTTTPKTSRRRADVGLDNLMKAKEFVQSQGGVEQAKRVLDAYAQLQ